jgi:hypothetical protein
MITESATMNWKELTNEIMRDVAKLVAATPEIKYIVRSIRRSRNV